MTQLEEEDIREVALLPYDWDKIDNSTILISGGTGFIGSFIINVFRFRNENCHANIKVVSLSRNGGQSDDTVTYLKADITESIHFDGNVDYILHLASNTHPKQYAEDPVGTILTNVIGCNNLLRLAVNKNIKRFLLASSVEIYGQGTETQMAENYCGYIDCNNARSGYNSSAYSKDITFEYIVFNPDESEDLGVKISCSGGAEEKYSLEFPEEIKSITLKKSGETKFPGKNPVPPLIREEPPAGFPKLVFIFRKENSREGGG